MIRAVVENGLIRPLDPMPDGWVEGHRVVVEALLLKRRGCAE